MSSTSDVKLTEEQIHNLLVEYLATKNVQLRDAVVLQYRNLVESVARRFANSGEPIEDLTQEGYIGLITAVDLYDAEKGVKFSTYATHFIIGQIKHALRDRGKIIKEPAWLQELNHRMTRVIESLYQEMGRQPTNAEIGRAMRLPEETVAEVLTTREIFKVASLDGEQDESSSGGVDLEKVKDDRYATFQLPVEDKIVLETAMNKLKIIEQKVIQEFYFNSLNQTEIAKKLGISCNYVSHILRSGTRKLRRILTTEEIREVQMQLQLANRRPETLDVDDAVVDNLTGLYNETYLKERLTEELTRAARDKSEVAFVVVAINGLEDLEVKHGAMMRDDALCSLAQYIKGSLRRCDIMGRLDGFEFGILLLYTNGQAHPVCERVLDAIRDVGFDTGRERSPVRFDSDIGYAAYPADGTSAEDLISAAKQSLELTRSRKMRKAA